MSVRIHRQVVADELDDPALTAAVQAALAHAGEAHKCVDVVLVDDATLAGLHDRFLDDASPTDVIAFDLGDPEDDDEPSGEVYVSVDRARDVAERRGVRVARELALYCVHGTLHLVGFDDIDAADRERMRAAEQVVMRSLGYADDRAPHDTNDE